MLSLLTTKYGTNILIIAASILALIAVYEVGHSSGETAGYKKGFDARQVTIDKLVTKINDDSIAVNDKIQTIQKYASDAVIEAKANTQTKIEYRDKIVTKFMQANPVVAASCGLDEVTVKSINELLATQIIYEEGSE